MFGLPESIQLSPVIAARPSVTKRANYYLLFSAITDIQLELYSLLKGVTFFDQSLHLKLRNLKANFERNSAAMHKMLTNHGQEDELLKYYKMVTIFERLMQCAHENDDFADLIGIIDQWTEKKLVILHSREELLEHIEEFGKEVANG